MAENESKFYFVGGQLGLDFINTLVGVNDEPVDFLRGFPDLVSWLQQAGVLDGTQAKAALASWGQRAEAKQVLDQARKLRNVLRETVERLSAGKVAGREALDEINRVLAQETGYNQLVRSADGYEFSFQPVRKQAVHLLTPIARSAAGLLSGSEPLRIRKCGNPVCSLYYYDTSKNRTRRWCSMAICGNRMKAALFYQRARKRKRRKLKT
ncbi:MAG: ABATE domain-containing protein [Gammaproteobacteria bacterium]|nr:ABATE domain-containing protein [Gammaproteobacteria bacterium]